jgi:hypothetical protein
MREPELQDQVSDGEPSRIRTGPALILLFAPILFFTGILGVHGGGFGTAAAIMMSLVSAPVGLVALIFGLPDRRYSWGWWFTRLYLSACGAAMLLACYDLRT